MDGLEGVEEVDGMDRGMGWDGMGWVLDSSVAYPLHFPTLVHYLLHILNPLFPGDQPCSG